MMPQSRILHSSTDTKTACARAQVCFDWSNYTIRWLAGQMIPRLDQTMESGDNMFIFSELTYDRVGGYLGHGDLFTLYRFIYGSYRGVPCGLDVLAVFGSTLTASFSAKFLTQITSGTDDKMAVVADVHTLSPRPPLPPWTALYLA